MLDRIFYHGIVCAMQQFIGKTVESIWIFGNGIKVVIQKFVHHDDGAIGDLGRPVVNMFNQCFDNILRADDSFQIVMRFGKKTAQPFLAANGSGKIQFVKNRKFFFLVKNGNIVEGGFIYLHDVKVAC